MANVTFTLLGRIAGSAVAALAVVAAGACSSSNPDAGTKAKSAECSVDADCAPIGPSGVCTAGHCVSKTGQVGAAPAQACDIPPSADTSKVSDAGYAGCKAEPPCTGGLCSKLCPELLHSLTCRQTTEPPASELGCSTIPIPTATGEDVYCCPCLNPSNNGTPLPACTWPPELNKGATTGATCFPSRAYVTCTLSSGVTEHCLSDKPAACPGVDPFDPCKDECQPDEYAVACGAVAASTVPDPPAGCRAIAPSPAGLTYYCCPCR